LKHYVKEHNKIVRKYIGVEIKQARAEYSKVLQVRRREMKEAQTIKLKGTKSELVDKILKERTMVRAIKYDIDNKRPPKGFKFHDGNILKEKKESDKPAKVDIKITEEEETDNEVKPDIKSSLGKNKEKKIKIRVAPKKKDIRKLPSTQTVLDKKEQIKKKSEEIKAKREKEEPKPKPKPKPKAKPEKKLTDSELKKAIGQLSPKDQKKVKSIKNIKSSEIKKIKFVNHLVLKYEIKVLGDSIETENKFKMVGQARPPSPEEETDEEEEEEPYDRKKIKLIKEIPKKIKEEWLDYMETRVPDEMYSESEQKDEYDELIRVEKKYFELEAVRKDKSKNTKQQAKANFAVANIINQIKDEVKENEGFKKMYKVLTPKLFNDIF